MINLIIFHFKNLDFKSDYDVKEAENEQFTEKM